LTLYDTSAAPVGIVCIGLQACKATLDAQKLASQLGPMLYVSVCNNRF